MSPKKDQDEKERREHPRVPMMVKVIDGEEVKKFFSREVSIGGLFLETQENYQDGQILTLQFQIPGTDIEINAKGKVVHRSTPEEGKGSGGVGIKFEDMDGRSEKLISEYVEKLENIRKKLSN